MLRFNFNDITWDKPIKRNNDILMEAPTDKLDATDYGNEEEVEVEEVDDDLEPKEEPKAKEDSEPEETPDETTTEDEPEEPTENEDELGGEDETSETNPDENSENEQPDNVEDNTNQEDNKSNKYLIRDFIELYNRLTEIIEKLNGESKLKSSRDPIYAQARKNLEKLKDTTYDYIVERFNEESYIFNLYQFNLIIQAINVNTELLSRSFSLKKEKENKKSNNKNKRAK